MVAKSVPPPRVFIVIDEAWLQDWMAYGFLEMDAFLANSAAFAEYLATHPRPEE